MIILKIEDKVFSNSLNVSIAPPSEVSYTALSRAGVVRLS